MLAQLGIRLRLLRGLFFVSPQKLRYLRMVRKSGLFDRDFYRGVNPGLHKLFRMFPERHFIAFGEAQGLRPNPDFSPRAYIQHNADLAVWGKQPFLHYVLSGHKESRVTKDMPVVGQSVLQQAPVVRGKVTQVKRPDYAVVIYMFYHDLWDEFSEILHRQDFDFDLFVSITDMGDETDTLVAQIEADFPKARILRMPNQGRDIFPFVHLVNSGVLDGYKAICKFHTKKSPHRDDGNEWRKHLIGSILPETGGKALADAFVADEKAAFLVADGQHFTSSEWWGSNREICEQLLRRVEVRAPEDGLSFPAGSIYWIKPLMISMIKGLQLDQSTFDREAAQVDGTLAHAFERSIGFLATDAGMETRQVTELLESPKPRALPKPRFTSAFYLPQFHPTPRNNAWWGTGFTEWNSMVRAKPQFPGHAHPQMPADLGFYDLRLPETMGQQYAMAKDAGIDAFCVYHYWFSGDRELEAPIDNLMKRPDIPFNFYLCWANESWRRNWDGMSGEILMDQRYEDGYEMELARDALPYMQDERYCRPDGKRPRFVIYRPDDMPDVVGGVARLRAAWRELGIGEVELGAVLFHLDDKAPIDPDLFDFWVEMPPHGFVGGPDFIFGGNDGNKMGMEPNPEFEGLIYDYNAVIKNSVTGSQRRKGPPHTIAGVMPCWDNTARRGAKAHMAWGANPGSFNRWMSELMEARIEDSYRGELFINAWNEWAEKAMLEPSAQYGRSYLDVLKRFL